MKLHTKRWKEAHGLTVLVEESHLLPLVDFDIAFPVGAMVDPKGKEGLTRTMWRVLRMGTGTMASTEVEERIAALGGRLSIQIATSTVRVQGVVIRRNLGAFLALLADVLRAPAFRPGDLGRARDESIAELVSLRDDDRTLAGRAFRAAVFGKHPYARPVTGSAQTLRRLSVGDLRRHYRAQMSLRGAVMGFAGDIHAKEVRALVHEHFGDFPHHAVPAPALPRPKAERGRHVVIVDKPSRTQSQILVGGLGVRVGEPDHMALVLGNTAFGGTFTSRLTQAVREERGWSYGASAHLGADRVEDTWFMATAPALADAVPCIELQLQLLEKLLAEGLTDEEHARGRDYLVNSHCFDVDTPSKRLEPRIDEVLYGLPFGFYAKQFEKLRRLRRQDVERALRKHLPNRDLVVALVAPARRVKKDLARLPGVKSVSVISHKRV